MPQLYSLLRGRSFFKRFSYERVCEMLWEMELALYRPNDLLFYEKDKVYVVISGNIVMKNHDGSI